MRYRYIYIYKHLRLCDGERVLLVDEGGDDGLDRRVLVTDGPDDAAGLRRFDLALPTDVLTCSEPVAM